MRFKRYNSIENSYRQKEVQSIEINFPIEKFVVQEKIHGSNFSLHTDGVDVKCAKRSGFIKGEEFFNHSIILNRLNDSVLSLHKSIGAETISVFGEIYGGVYPHEDVEKVDVKRVQKGVYYSPDIEFIAFDIVVNGQFVDFNTFEKLCVDNNIPYLPALTKGTLQECLKFPNEYQTTIPNKHGLPEIENNTCEGNVIRPVNVLFHGNGSRVILKNKNSKFKEKEGSSSKKSTPSIPKEVPENIKVLQIAAVEYINENRLRNVLSKVGGVSQKEFGKVLGLFAKDALEDFEKDNSEYTELENIERKMITSLVNRECGNIIRPNWLNIIDGEF